MRTTSPDVSYIELIPVLLHAVLLSSTVLITTIALVATVLRLLLVIVVLEDSLLQLANLAESLMLLIEQLFVQSGIHLVPQLEQAILDVTEYLLVVVLLEVSRQLTQRRRHGSLHSFMGSLRFVLTDRRHFLFILLLQLLFLLSLQALVEVSRDLHFLQRRFLSSVLVDEWAVFDF